MSADRVAASRPASPRDAGHPGGVAAFWFIVSGTCITAGAILLWRARRRPERADEPPAVEEPFDLFKEN